VRCLYAVGEGTPDLGYRHIMSHDMLHHAELKTFFEVLHMFEFIWI
jgi:hypothetical protein